MNFSVGDIPFFREYQFTDTGKTAPHFGLVLLPENATRYTSSVLCCVITSQQPNRKKWSLLLKCSCYSCFTNDSHACFDRKDLVSKNGLGNDPQPKAKLNKDDLKRAYKVLRGSLFVIKDLANDPHMRGVIIYEWKKALGLLKTRT
jgi:mRNA-degrading endonuclease toxin of MazEF toxin-antitoxin module